MQFYVSIPRGCIAYVHCTCIFVFLTDFGSGQVSHKFVFDSTSGPLVCESIEIVDDNNFEGTERFSATLSRTSSSAVELSTISAEITITDPSNGKYIYMDCSPLVRLINFCYRMILTEPAHDQLGL